MFLNYIHIFMCIASDDPAIETVVLGERDHDIQGKAASCRIEYVPGLLGLARLVFRNETGDALCVFVSVNGQAAVQPIHVPAAICGAVPYRLPPPPPSAPSKMKAPADARNKQARPAASAQAGRNLGEDPNIRIYELRVFTCPDIQHLPAVPEEEGKPLDPKWHEQCAPTPDQWSNPRALFRFVCTPRGTLVPLSKLREISAVTWPLKPSLPPSSAMGTDFPTISSYYAIVICPYL
ncbi:hypothetical protein FOMPIDRAFT_1054328 [Fomitopsis schrenkii]|uniref:Uncharacterized protein n=1 Tax=Fomitopsis schrenkii TaxID=2126942 RepID=S8F9C4_FOMSC|nr:hypothetical protein FOMPIDRAFT_1054328 [Fomitopsis schrenkii]